MKESAPTCSCGGVVGPECAGCYLTRTTTRPGGKFEPGAPWAPTKFTPPLRPRFLTDGPRLVALAERHWRTPDERLIKLDQWQRALFSHVLERYPLDWHVPALRGRLRYRQVVVSMGRQNGKSIIGGLLALYGLAQHVTGPSVIGIATSVQQANIVYGRVAFAVRKDAELRRRWKATGTRGITSRDGGAGTYAVRPNLEEGIQGEPVTLGVADELHLSKEAMWDSIVIGQRAQQDALLVGITTAGDDTSVLLKRLYTQGTEAIEGQHERFGFFLWEAPAGSTIDTPGAIEAANPAVAEGRIPVETVRADVSRQPEVDQQRYTLNLFVASVNTWLPLGQWTAAGGHAIPDDLRDHVTFTVDKTPSWEAATITATATADGILWTEVVASVVKPTRDKLAALCERLHDRAPQARFVMDGQLGDLGRELNARGLETVVLSRDETAQACAAAYAAITTGRVRHAGDQLLAVQMPRARRKNSGEGWRLSRVDSSTEIDAVLATVYGLFEAERNPPAIMQLF